MEIKQYIQNCIDNNDILELTLSWHFLGEDTCSNSTKYYRKDRLYLILQEDSVFNEYIFYCDQDHVGKIDWTNIKTLDEANQTTLVNGLTATCFTFFNQKISFSTISDYTTIVDQESSTYKPFEKYAALSSNNEDIIIDDDQYYQIMQVIGQPFIKDRELEYSRQAILKLAIEPALRMYYTYFPLVQEQVINTFASGDFMIPYPTQPYPAYKAIAWVTSAGANMRSNTMNGLSPLTALGTDVSLYTRASTGNRFAQGIRYNKPVPGYTGEGTSGGTSAYSELATAWPVANTMKNIMRREKLSKVHIPGQGLFAKGYSSVSGFLNIRWLCWSRDFNDVEFEDWNKVIRLCQAHVKKSIGSIRELLRTDSNIPFKEGLQKEGDTEVSEIEKEWSQSPSRLIYTPARGGIVG